MSENEANATGEGHRRERRPLYRRWAGITVDCDGRTQEQVVEAILTAADLEP